MAVYFLVLHWLPLPLVARKLLLWSMLGIPGIWWVDLQLDGVKRGHLAQQPPDRVPHPGSVIAANFTSPVDAVYLAAIFDPVFTISYPHERKLLRVSLLGAVLHALSPAQLAPPPDPKSARLTDLRALLDRYPDRVIAVFPECGTTNGRGVLPLSPSLLAAPAGTHTFPVSMRYTPPDITTPVPGAYLSFLWKLLSRPTHCIRVRIAEPVRNTSRMVDGTSGPSSMVGSDDGAGEEEEKGGEEGSDLTPEEKLVLDKIAEALARLGRNKRVGLTLRDKASFVEAWKRGRK